MPDSLILDCITDIYHRYYCDNSGQVADYIPELAKANPEHFGICIVTADGRIYEVGQSQHPFTIQSISKPFVYGLALADQGWEKVLKKVGVEPTGEAFNSIVFDEVNNRPYNPMVNAGAIATTALIQGENYEARFQRILDLFGRLAGHPLEVDEAVFQSERNTGHRNRAIAYLELNAGMIEEPISEHLDLYFRQCSILVTAKDLAVMAATLANNGINPITQEKAIDSEQVKSILSVMASCGMYDFSGEWLYRIGLPAKSGVGGGIIATLPSQFGIGTYSPLLDARGNSVRGIRVCEDLSQHFKLHLFDFHPVVPSCVRRIYTGETISSKRQRRVSQRQLLEQYGSQIVVYELLGDLYFASMENLLNWLKESQLSMRFLILDCRRLRQADNSALSLLLTMQQWLSDQNIILLFSDLPTPICEQLQAQGWSDAACFDPIDETLEWCENRLLMAFDPQFGKIREPLSFEQMDIFQRFSQEEMAVLKPLFTEVHYAPQTFIIQEGEKADHLFLLAAGTVTISIKLPDSDRRKRLTTYIPGIAFGELGLFSVEKRSADVISDTDVTCFVLPLARLEELLETTPEVYVKLLRLFGKVLVDSLRRLTEEVRSLSLN